MAIGSEESHELQPTIISYVKDFPNLCSLAGLACTLLAIYFSILGVYYAAMIGMIWAVAFDWADGLVARRLKGRTGSDRIFGGQLDLLIDIVSISLAAGVIRLSYFSTFGLSDESKYTGLALDNNNIALVFIFLFESVFSPGIFTVILCISVLGLAALNVSQVKTPKFSGVPRNVYLLAFYTFGITGIYGWKLF
jgi:CDP-diacylglycerol--serine O-phosphatidyltransferase